MKGRISNSPLTCIFPPTLTVPSAPGEGGGVQRARDAGQISGNTGELKGRIFFGPLLSFFLMFPPTNLEKW
ncbi:hypothetical protein L249_7260 [Ophiocordyceps polyrhachis-furcata BCC 54312]|uniref:Uncharacterized protein n=1 Tax=Ophiocordyceps polyrhachis-furcata BCC 54312 TaxID=1330021 RepID=A0A367L9T4_9HYPO|nr:hypothetical protein L249_7260 [Ophiocordyceps polyrhachis-furcata BCC 54312]